MEQTGAVQNGIQELEYKSNAGQWAEDQCNALTDSISREIIKSGFAYIVTTTLRNKKTLRMCIINANTTEDDIRRTVALLNEIAVRETEKLRSE